MFDAPFIGLVIPFGGINPPAGWLFCHGQELLIYENPNLFLVIGTTFGGDGDSTFALPNLCGRVAVHAGQAHQTYYSPGQIGGNETVVLTTDNLPVHQHKIKRITGRPLCTSIPGTRDAPAGNYPAPVNGSPVAYSTAATDLVNMGSTVLTLASPVGPPDQTQQPITIMSPYLTMNYIICFEGSFPPHG